MTLDLDIIRLLDERLNAFADRIDSRLAELVLSTTHAIRDCAEVHARRSRANALALAFGVALGLAAAAAPHALSVLHAAAAAVLH
jgi:hypothetical protein